MVIKRFRWQRYNKIPAPLKKEYQLKTIFLRPFGLFKEDLDIDFFESRRPHLSIAILSCCSRKKNDNTLDPDFFWDLPVSTRIEMLLAVAEFATGTTPVIPLTCSEERCGEQMEFDISQEEIAGIQDLDKHEEHLHIINRKMRFVLRRPTGRDQLNWLDSDVPGEEEMRSYMVHSLLVMDKTKTAKKTVGLSKETVAAIDKAMNGFDPLVDFTVSITCPYCDKENRFTFDLEAYALDRLHKSQLGLLHEINDLAHHFHWNEDEILSIPPWRRHKYLSMVEAGRQP